MKKTLCIMSALALMASVVIGAESRSLRSVMPGALAPSLAGQASAVPIPTPISPTPDPGYETYIPVSQPFELFPDVRYHGKHNIAPCAVPTVIQVADPCNRNPCCKTCVNVQICVPPCDPACVKVTRDGHRVRYDFGKYAVVAKTVGDHIVVRYID